MPIYDSTKQNLILNSLFGDERGKSLLAEWTVLFPQQGHHLRMPFMETNLQWLVALLAEAGLSASYVINPVEGLAIHIEDRCRLTFGGHRWFQITPPLFSAEGLRVKWVLPKQILASSEWHLLPETLRWNYEYGERLQLNLMGNPVLDVKNRQNRLLRKFANDLNRIIQMTHYPKYTAEAFQALVTAIDQYLVEQESSPDLAQAESAKRLPLEGES